MKLIKLNRLTVCTRRYKSTYWSSQVVRQTFIDYFKSKDHVFVPSSSVIPKKQDGSYFVNSGMNQFKSIFTGSIGASESDFTRLGKVTNHQKCIRVGGKHNDLEDVGHDYYHHTFFEMLGNWSFNNSYSKREACKMAWELLTEVYKIPASHLYITYFHGNEALNLPADLECKEIWRSLGVPEERILPFGMAENFWSMGATGPCGPCTEIHYCHPSHHKTAVHDLSHSPTAPSRRGRVETDFDVAGGGATYRQWVNAGREEVKEVWNLVFMQYDMHADRSLHRLPQEHIDTGMGLERLTALLQHSTSNYDTDLFVDLFSHIATFAHCPPYRGSLTDAVDVAYRVVADHARMATVCISDGLMPGRRESAGKLRQVMYRCLHQLESVLKAPRGFMASLAPLVAHSLADAYPEVARNVHLLRDVMNETEDRYQESVKVARKVMKKAVKQFQTPLFSGEQMMSIQEGKFGKSVSVDLMALLADEFGVRLAMPEYEEMMRVQRETKAATPSESIKTFPPLSQQDVQHLRNLSVPVTDDSHKHLASIGADSALTPLDLVACIKAIKCLRSGRFVAMTTAPKQQQQQGMYIVITDKTNFYAEAGGQESDVGSLSWNAVLDVDAVGGDGGVDAVDGGGGDSGAAAGVEKEMLSLARVSHVGVVQGYVSHYVCELASPLSVGQTVLLSIDQASRAATTRNHTATHLIHASLNQVLGAVVQQGSAVKKDQLTFDFTSLKSNVTLDDLREVVRLIDGVVEEDLVVYRSSRSYREVQDCEHVSKLEEVYPSTVTLVSIGVPPDEILSSSSPSSVTSSSTPSPFSSSPALPSPPLPQSIELCGGTHVARTGQLGRVVVTNFEGSIQGNKRITAVTGERANQAVKNAKELMEMLAAVKECQQVEEVAERLKQIDKLLTSKMLLGKVEREQVLQEMKMLHLEHSHSKNKLTLIQLFKEVSAKVKAASKDHYCIVCMPVNKLRSLARCLVELNHPKPIFIIADAPNPNLLGLCYVPQHYTAFTSVSWIAHVCSSFDGQYSPPQGKLSRHEHICLFTIPVKKHHTDSSAVMALAEAYVVSKLSLSDAAG